MILLDPAVQLSAIKMSAKAAARRRSCVELIHHGVSESIGDENRRPEWQGSHFARRRAWRMDEVSASYFEDDYVLITAVDQQHGKLHFRFAYLLLLIMKVIQYHL